MRQNQKGKHIDLKALRNNGDPVRKDQAKKPLAKKQFRKGDRDFKRNKKAGKPGK